MKKILALATFILLMGLSAMLVQANSTDTRRVTASNTLNVRYGPGTSFRVLYVINRDQEVTVLDTSPGPGNSTWHFIGWHQPINRGEEFIWREGWVNGSFLSPPLDGVVQAPPVTTPPPLEDAAASIGDPIFPVTRWVSVPYSLNVRDEPTMNPDNIRTVIFRYERVEITRRFGPVGGDWYFARLISNNYVAVGWVIGRYLSVVDGETPPPPIRPPAQVVVAAPVTPEAPETPEAPAPAPAPQQEDMGALIGTWWRVNRAGLNVRDAPSNDGTVVNGLARGDAVEVLETFGRGEFAWFRIRHVGERGRYITGWVFRGTLERMY